MSHMIDPVVPVSLPNRNKPINIPHGEKRRDYDESVAPSYVLHHGFTFGH